MSLNKNEFIEKVKASGVVGAGGAGFPTHIKLNNQCDYFIVNIAECEPLLRADQHLAEKYASFLIQAVQYIHEMLNAQQSYIAIKKKYTQAIKSLSPFVKHSRSITFKYLDNVYPAGDEQDIVYNCTGRIVPQRGIPPDVGVIVDNVQTVLNVYHAIQDKPVTDKWVTVTGFVKDPSTCRFPIGMEAEKVLGICGGPTIKDYVLIEGGPMMGEIIQEGDTIKKTTSSVIVFPAGHFLIKRKKQSIKHDLIQAKSACEQCYLCTEYCPRYLLGHSSLQPHLMMRKISYLNEQTPDSFPEAALCCECGICSLFACPMLLSPRDVYHFLKQGLSKGIVNKLPQDKIENVHSLYQYRRAPVTRLVQKLGIKNMEHPALIKNKEITTDRVRIALKQHVGSPSIPEVKVDDRVKKGQRIASLPEGQIGANLHASINGRVTAVSETYIQINFERY
ncbi:MAG: SLBB domain-containing protein [Spirochaetes bacterium]|nr:SLBB domain-containing protein [Spirochaetota bacterium]